MAYHIPVLSAESIEGLDIKPNGSYIDLTFGGGGHSSEILKKLGKSGKLLVFDQDPDALANNPHDKRVTFIHSNFRYLRNFLEYYNTGKVDGVLADLGISSYQIDTTERGFTYLHNTALDMRMNKRSEKTAADILNLYTEDELNRIFREYGEIRNYKFLTRLVVESRNRKKIEMTGEFIENINAFLAGKKRYSVLSKIFQSLRIEVNDELEALKEMLIQVNDYLKTGGRIVIITYHSLEDRIVKNFFRSGNFKGNVEKDFFGNTIVPFRLITKNAVSPAMEEIEKNSRARSAKLRIAEKI